MQCEACHGLGVVVNPAAREERYLPLGMPLALPCPDCGGCGAAHCCEGFRPDLVVDEASGVLL